MRVLEMVRERLLADGYDGLVDEHGECGCRLDDLAPCGEMGEGCEAAHAVATRIEASGFDFVMFAGPRAKCGECKGSGHGAALQGEGE